MQQEKSESPAESTRATQSSLTLSWRVVALGSLLLTFAIATALVIVAAIRRVDVLSTVALSLAVLAFVAQIITFIMQASTASEAMRQSESLYSETQGLLREVRATAQATQDLLTRQFDRVLEHALKGVPSEGKTEEGGPIVDAAEVRRRFSEALELAADEARNRLAHGAEPATSRPSQEALDRIKWFRSNPQDEDEGTEAYEVLRSLTPLQLRLLLRYATDEIDSLEKGIRPGLAWSTPSKSREGLIEKDLLEKGWVNDEGKQMGVLTEKGRRVARLLTASDKAPPEYLLTLEQEAHEQGS